MESIKEINIKNQAYNFFYDMTNIKYFDSKLLKIDKKSYKHTDINYVAYITMKDGGDYENIYGLITLYFIIIGEADRYIEKKNRNK